MPRVACCFRRYTQSNAPSTVQPGLPCRSLQYIHTHIREQDAASLNFTRQDNPKAPGSSRERFRRRASGYQSGLTMDCNDLIGKKREMYYAKQPKTTQESAEEALSNSGKTGSHWQGAARDVPYITRASSLNSLAGSMAYLGGIIHTTNESGELLFSLRTHAFIRTFILTTGPHPQVTARYATDGGGEDDDSVQMILFR